MGIVIHEGSIITVLLFAIGSILLGGYCLRDFFRTLKETLKETKKDKKMTIFVFLEIIFEFFTPYYIPWLILLVGGIFTLIALTV